MDKLLTVKQTAERLQVNHNTLQVWRNNGKGPAYIKIGGLVRYRESDVEAWLNANFRNPADKLVGKQEGCQHA